MADTLANRLENLALDSAPDTMLASTRVFNIPELLERILHDLTSSLPRRKSKRFGTFAFSTRYRLPLPAYQLFPLQRVNSRFRDTILRSPIMQRYMFLCIPIDLKLPDDPWAYHDPIFWLLDRLNMFISIDGSGSDWQRVSLKVTGLPSTSAAVMSPEASWRKMVTTHRVGFANLLVCKGTEYLNCRFAIGEEVEVGAVIEQLLGFVPSSEGEKESS